MAIDPAELIRASKVGQRADGSLESLTTNAAQLQEELSREDPSSFFVTLQVTQIVGQLSGDLNDAIDSLRQFREETLDPAADGLRTTERVANRLEPIFNRLEEIPVSVVRKAAKALSTATNVYGDAAGTITPTLTRVESRLDQLDAKAQKFQKVLKVFGKLDEVADALEVIRQTAIDVAERDEQDAATIEAALIRDLNATQSADGETIAIDLPAPVLARVTEALEAFDARLASRSEAIREVLDRIDDFIDRVFELAPDLGALPDAPDLPDIEAVFADFILDFQASIEVVLNAIDALAVLDSISFLGDLGNLLNDFASVLDEVMDVVNPFLNFLGPVTSAINAAIEEVEDAIGLTDLLERVENGLRQEIQGVIDDINDKIEDMFGQLELPDVELLEQIALDLDFLRARVGFFELNPVAQIGSDSTLLGDALDDRAIIAALDGDDLVELPIDDDFDDGFGGMALGGDGDDTLEGTALADLLIGGAGADGIFGRDGDDVMLGGDDSDVLAGGEGDDQGVGGDGLDVISGNSGDDMLFGERGADLLFGGAGDDFLAGGDGADRLEAGADNDTLDGGAGADLLIAAEGVNILDGDADLDVIQTIGSADAVHTILDATARLIGGDGIDIVSIGDVFGIAGEAFVEASFGSVFYDAAGNVDRFEAGDFDLDGLAAKLANFEVLRIESDFGEAKTLSTSTDNLPTFDLLELQGEGAISIVITDGEFVMDGDGRQLEIDFSQMPTVQNPQDGALAGADGRPISAVIPLTVILAESGGGTVFGPEASGIGLTFVGGDGDDFIVGGSGSDLIMAGLGQDTINGGRGDGGDRFELDGAVGDVILGTPEELDGDLILNFSNRVDRVRVIGETIDLVGAGDETSTVVSIFDDGADTGFSFTLEGNFPKLRVEQGSFFDGDGAEVFYTEIFNNNVPPTAVDDDIEARYQGPGDEDLALDPFENDFDADTPAAPEDGVERRQVAVTESLAFLLRQIVDENGDPVPFDDEDGTRIAFNQGIAEVAVGTEFVTKLGNKLILTNDGLVYEARNPEIMLRRVTADDPGVQEGEEDGFYDATEDVPFFGLDQIEYKVFDTEGELSNIASIDILIRPDAITLADGSTGLPTVLVRGETIDGELEEVVATLSVVPEGERTPENQTRLTQFSEDLANAVGKNEYFEITAPGSYFGDDGNDVLDARGAAGAVSLFGGDKADWLEGGAFDDFLSGGGIGEAALRAATATQVPSPTDSALTETEADDGFAPQPNILIGGAGDNVFSSSFAFTDEISAARENIFILDGGAEKVIGPTHGVNFDGQSGSITLDPLPFAGPTAIAAKGLEGDRIDGFDQDDHVILPIDMEPLTGDQSVLGSQHSAAISRTIILAESTIPGFPDLTTTLNFSADVTPTFEIPNATGLIVTDQDVASLQGMTNEEVLSELLPGFSFDTENRARGGVITLNDLFAFPNQTTTQFASFYNGAPQIISYDIEADFIDENGGASPTTQVTVSMESFDWNFSLNRVEGATNVNFTIANPLISGVNFATLQQDYVFDVTLGRGEGLIDPADLFPELDADLSFTFELEGQYRDRFVVDLIPMEVDAANQTVVFDDAVSSGIGGGFSTDFLSEQEVLSIANDGHLGFALRYVSAAPEPVADEAAVRRGEAVTLDLTANDSDGDGDPIGIFDIVFDSADQEADLLDGDVANGELILEIDPNTGFGTGVVTYIAPQSFIGDVHFAYIAEDGEFQSAATDVSITVTGLPPVLGDDVFILPFATDGFISYAEILANDIEPDAGAGETLDFASLLTNPDFGDAFAQRLVAAEGVGPDDIAIPAEGGLMAIGLELTDSALAALRAAPAGADGVLNGVETLTYTLEDAGGGGRSNPGAVSIAVAEAFALAAPDAAEVVVAAAGDKGATDGFEAIVVTAAEPAFFAVDEDSAITIDLLADREGGFGDAEIISVSAAVAEGTDISVGEVEITGDGVLFTPTADLSGVTAVFAATARDQAGQEASVEVRVEIAPTEDAPEVVILTPAGDPLAIETDEDTPVEGALFLFDADAADPAILGVQGALDLLDLISGDPGALDPAALAGLAAVLPMPENLDPIMTSAGGEFALSATGTPGIFGYLYASLEDVNGDDLASVPLAPLPGETEGDVAEIAIRVASVNDAPFFAGEPTSADDPVLFTAGDVLIVNLLASADDIDGSVDSTSLRLDSEPDSDVAGAFVGDDGVLELFGFASGAGALTYSVADDLGLRSESATLHFRVNAAPEAATDIFRLTAPFEPIVIDAIGNDSDLEGPVFYVLGPDGAPVAIAPPGDGDRPGASSTLGDVVFSAEENAFVYTPPTDPGLLGRTDRFFYEIEDADGARARGSVVIDLVDPEATDAEFRFGSTDADVLQASPGAETFALGDGADRLEGPLANFVDDVVLDFQPDDLLRVLDPPEGEISFAATRERAARPDANDVDPAAPTPEQLFGDTSVEDLAEAFIGQTVVTISIGDESADLTLLGAYLGDFEATRTASGVDISYAPNLSGSGILEGGDEAEDIRGDGVLNGNGGDDVLMGDGPSVVLNGGEGDDVLIATGGAVDIGPIPIGPEVFIRMSGGAGADLFLIANGSAAYDIVDFNPGEGDRIGLAKGAFVNDDFSADLTRLRVVPFGDPAAGVFALQGLPDEDDAIGEPINLAIFPVLESDNAIPVILSDGFQVDENIAAVGVVEAEDADVLDVLTFSIDPVADGALFSIDEATGAISFLSPPDFESPSDGDVDNVYSVRVRVSDGAASSVRDISVAVADVPEGGDDDPVDVRGSDDPDVLRGRGGDDKLTGRGGDDDLRGGDGDDELFGGDGEDTLFGEGDDDRLFGRGDDDELDGGAGDDVLRGNQGEDLLLGGAGDDLLLGGGDDDVLDGGDDDDRLRGHAGDDELTGGEGDDDLRGGDGDDDLFGDAGDDRLRGEAGDDELFGGDGEDSLIGAENNDMLFGGADADVLDGGAGADTLEGGAGDDVLRGRSGADMIDGGGDADVAFGGSGADMIFGGAGDDALDGESGADVVSGEAGEDVLRGGDGDDELRGGDDADTLFGGEDDDDLFGDGGEDMLFGGAGADDLNGGDASDLLFGGADGDVLNGGDGADTLNGGAGDDVLNGGLGIDRLNGGFGADVFELLDDDASDVIVGFEVGVDRLAFAAGAAATGTTEAIVFSGKASTLATSDAVSAILVGVSDAQFDDLIAMP